MEKLIVMDNIYNVDVHEGPALLCSIANNLYLDNNGCLEKLKKAIEMISKQIMLLKNYSL